MNRILRFGARLPARLPARLSALKARYSRQANRSPNTRFGLTLKMFLAVLCACLLVSLSMGYAIRISFENGFLHYVRNRDAGRVKALTARLQANYAVNGGWDYLRNHPEAWFALLDAAREDTLRQDAADALTGKSASWLSFPGGVTVHQLLASPSRAHESPWGMQIPRTVRETPMLPLDRELAGPIQSESGHIIRPLQIGASAVDATPVPSPSHYRHPPVPLPQVALFDADKHMVATTLYGTASEASLQPILLDGKTIGWLSASGSDSLSDAADIAFQAQQMRSTLQIAVVAVVIAALVALLLARIVLAPVKRLMNATHRLANGDFSARVSAGRHDELGKLAGDFNMLADSLEKTERARRDVLADISHELRTPLAVLRGELEAIEDGVRTFDKDTLTSLQAEVSMLNAIIEDLYELSLSDVGALSYRKTPADVGKLANASVEAFRESFKAKHLALHLDLPVDAAGDYIPLVFAVDPGRFTQLLKNLLQNSLRYTDPEGEVRLKVSASAHEWRLEVQDSSPDVPLDSLPHLFDRLYRVDESRSRLSGGAGLGLALCSAIVAAHGGTIEAQLSPLGGIWVSAHFPTDTPSS